MKIASREMLSSEVRAILDCESTVPILPSAVRARLLSRSRLASMTGNSARRRSTASTSRIRWCLGMVSVFAASSAVGAAAYEFRARLTGSAELLGTTPEPTSVVSTAPFVYFPHARATAIVTPRPPRRTARPSLANISRTELRLLRQARATVARQQFAAALRPIAEHERRFQDGYLAEEREALRVRALAGLCRSDEAKRAAAAFLARFPDSVLWPFVSQMPGCVP